MIDCDIGPRLTRESSEAFAKVVQDVIGSAQLAGMIESGYFADLNSEHALPSICPDHNRKNNSEYIKTRSVDSIANIIIGEVEDRHLPVEE